MYNIAIGCDPNALFAKKDLIVCLETAGYKVTDMGSDDPLYANIAHEVAQAVASGNFDRGILICGTGLGVSIAANKVKGSYAALLSDVYSAKRACMSNNANIACFGAFTLGIKLMEELALTFLSSEFDVTSSSKPKVDRIRYYESKL